MSKNQTRFRSWLLLLVLSVMSFYSQSVLANKTKAASPQASQEKTVPSNNSSDKATSTNQPEAATQDIKPTSEGMVNINKADAEELAKKLKGIGVRKAKAIIEYRETFGDFKSVENIQEVPGIGPVFIEMNRDKIIL
nr:ComEA family DNA-binding protein [uncultured Moellerella sp.]